tara:strand:- start:311 stop:415 length:105 start_codon:yes stop_codon:yes gene_type:complete
MNTSLKLIDEDGAVVLAPLIWFVEKCITNIKEKF